MYTCRLIQGCELQRKWFMYCVMKHVHTGTHNTPATGSLPIRVINKDELLAVETQTGGLLYQSVDDSLLQFW